MDTDNALEQLKSIHNPDNVSVFPLAIGWYVLVVVIITIMAVLIWLKIKQNKKKKQIKDIYKLLSDIEKNSHDSQNLLTETSILIKRVAVFWFPTANPHTLFGEEWLQFLDSTGKTKDFTQGVGRNLLNVYRQEKIDEPEKFFALIRNWLDRVL